MPRPIEKKTKPSVRGKNCSAEIRQVLDNDLKQVLDSATSSDLRITLLLLQITRNTARIK